MKKFNSHQASGHVEHQKWYDNSSSHQASGDAEQTRWYEKPSSWQASGDAEQTKGYEKPSSWHASGDAEQTRNYGKYCLNTTLRSMGPMGKPVGTLKAKAIKNGIHQTPHPLAIRPAGTLSRHRGNSVLSTKTHNGTNRTNGTGTRIGQRNTMCHTSPRVSGPVKVIQNNKF